MATVKHSWIKDMTNAVFEFENMNLHLSEPSLQSYLAYYSFDVTAFDEYRCGTVKAGERKLFLQAFLKNQAKGTVLFVHGYLDHSGGMSRTVNELLYNGYNVVTLDLPGHGFSQGEAGTIASFDEYVTAVKNSYDLIKLTLGLTHITGLGHSTGGAILFHAVSEKNISLERLLLVAPLYLPYRWTVFKGMLKMAGKIIPRSRRRFKKNSEDQVYRQFIKSDPLQIKWLKSDWMEAMDSWQKRITNCPVIHIPVYLLQGEKDTTVDGKKNILFYKRKCRDLQIAFFPHGRHQLLNEKDGLRKMVYERIMSFLSNS